MSFTCVECTMRSGARERNVRTKNNVVNFRFEDVLNSQSPTHSSESKEEEKRLNRRCRAMSTHENVQSNDRLNCSSYSNRRIHIIVVVMTIIEITSIWIDCDGAHRTVAPNQIATQWCTTADADRYYGWRECIKIIANCLSWAHSRQKIGHKLRITGNFRTSCSIRLCVEHTKFAHGSCSLPQQIRLRIKLGPLHAKTERKKVKIDKSAFSFVGRAVHSLWFSFCSHWTVSRFYCSVGRSTRIHVQTSVCQCVCAVCLRQTKFRRHKNVLFRTRRSSERNRFCMAKTTQCRPSKNKNKNK